MNALKMYDPIRAGRRLKEVPWRRYVAMGDSITEGVLGDPYPPYPEIGYAQMVADALEARRSDMRFFNLGKRYLTSRQIRESQLGRALEFGRIWSSSMRGRTTCCWSDSTPASPRANSTGWPSR
jgi:hypothetical protein